ncbi:MAG: DUF4872 domain-containing protein [Anaerolineales bacterium]
MTTLKNYKHFGGGQIEAATAKNALAYLGATAPHTSETFSDALLFGIGGGIGVGYFLYASGDFVSLFIATQITGGPEFLPNLLKRLGCKTEPQNSSSIAAWEKKLRQALSEGRPFVTWVNPLGLPYPGAAAYHPLIVYGVDGEVFHVADRSARPLTVTRAEMAQAQQSGDPPRFRSLLVSAPAKTPDVARAARQGIAECVDQMLNGFGPKNYRNNFGLAGLEKWAGLLTDAKDKRGWPKFFPRGPRLFTALTTAFEHIENRGGGSAHRSLYADFLSEAATLLKKPKLSDVAEQFRASGKRWRKVSEALLPNAVPLFKEYRQLSTQRRTSFEKKGMAAREEWQAIHARLDAIKAEAAKDFPLGESEAPDLLGEVRERVLAVHAAERQAVLALKAAMA